MHLLCNFEINLTDFSGLQCPTGGSGGIGAPSHSNASLSTGTSGTDLCIISEVSTARDIVEDTRRL